MTGHKTANFDMQIGRTNGIGYERMETGFGSKVRGPLVVMKGNFVILNV